MVRKLCAETLVLVLFLFVLSAGARTVKIPLYEVSPVKTVTLRGATSKYSVKIPVPRRWRIERAVLRFGYVNSSALIPQNSRLVVEINGCPFAQIKLDPVATEGEAKVLIPVNLLTPGYNTLTFRVSQHYTLDCEDPSAPELWTTLKLGNAWLKFTYSPLPVPLRLSSISDFLFDPKMFAENNVNIIIDRSLYSSLSVVGVVASGVALRFDYRKVFFTVSEDIRPGCDNILVGTKGFVEEFLGQRGIKTTVKGAFLKIAHLPGDEYHALLVVSGEDVQQVRTAAEVLALLSFPLPDVDEMQVVHVEVPEVHPYTGKLVISPGKKYTFGSMGFVTRTLKGMSPPSVDLVFRLPADLFVKPNEYANIYLHMAYGAGMRSDSVLNIILNGEYVTAIHLDDPHGKVFSAYRVSIPTYMFKSGYNKLTFAPVLTPSVTGRCKFIQTKNLFLTIFEDSYLHFPSMPHWVELPKTELFFREGFPFTRWPDGRDTVIYIAQPGHEGMAAALNVVGFLTQRIGYPLLGVQLTLGKLQERSKEIIVLSTVGTFPQDLWEAAPIRFSEVGLIPYPVDAGPRGKRFLSWWGKFKEEVMALVGRGRKKGRSLPPFARLSFVNGTLGLALDRGMVMEFQSPYKKGRSVLALLATTPSALNELSRALLEAGVQTKCSGSVSVIDFGSPCCRVHNLDVGGRYYTGRLGRISRVSSHIHSRFWLFFASLVLVLLLLTLTIFYFLKRYRKKRVAA